VKSHDLPEARFRSDCAHASPPWKGPCHFKPVYKTKLTACTMSRNPSKQFEKEKPARLAHQRSACYARCLLCIRTYTFPLCNRHQLALERAIVQSYQLGDACRQIFKHSYKHQLIALAGTTKKASPQTRLTAHINLKPLQMSVCFVSGTST